MILGIQGSAEFNDYAVVLSGMALALKRMEASEFDDDTFVVYSAGPEKLNNMALEFVNVSDFKSRGITAKSVYVPESWFKENYSKLDLFFYFCDYNQPLSKLSEFLDKKEVDVQAMRYRAVKQ